MGKAFEKVFSEPVNFYPDGWHLSRNKFSRDQAALEIGQEIGEVIDAEKLQEGWVRFQLADESIRDELGVSQCWMEVSEGSNGAQPTWEYCITT